MYFRTLAALAALTSIAPAGPFQEGAARATELRKSSREKVSNATLDAQWFEGDSHLWFELEKPDGGRETIVADTADGKRETRVDSSQLPRTPATPQKRGRRSASPAQKFPNPTPKSPDGEHQMEIREHNLFVRAAGGDEWAQLTADGEDGHAYRPQGFWSPDSKRVVVLRVREAQKHPVHMIESSPKDQKQPKLHTHNYLKPGDQIARPIPHLFDLETRKEIPVDPTLFENPWSIRSLHWTADGKELRFVYNQRGHQVLRVIGIDASSGATRCIIDETSPTFIDYSQKHFVHFLQESSEILWSSERDGWHHLYLFDANTGALKNQITSGDWIVRSIEKIDTEKRQITFRAMGIYPDRDPYHVHFARIDFDGSNLTHLTEGDGTHRLRYSPTGQFYLDTYCRVDLPPVHELRRSSDGKLVCELARASTSADLQHPQRFVARGRDGETDIHGIIIRPSQFDPAKKYPVIEKIYAGPHGHFVPKEFSAFHRAQEIAEHGFIVVQIDGMGTNFRSKAFHDVCWQNLMDSGFPDRIAWLEAAARQHPELDLDRVGIFGGSAGGQSTLAGMLNHPEFYKVGVADCGCHDNRMDKIWWNEAWMGTVGDHYDANSNVTHAHKLRGHLLLTAGELDRNVDPASTMQVVDALIKADRDFDMIVVPGAGHGVGESPYLARRRIQFFLEHLK